MKNHQLNARENLIASLAELPRARSLVEIAADLALPVRTVLAIKCALDVQPMFRGVNGMPFFSASEVAAIAEVAKELPPPIDADLPRSAEAKAIDALDDRILLLAAQGDAGQTIGGE
jgi:hypothetical protein